MSSYGRVVVVSENSADCLLSKVLFPLFREFWFLFSVDMSGDPLELIF